MPSTLRVQLQLRIVSDDDTMIRDERLKIYRV
jgi:hypothetical protein